MFRTNRIKSALFIASRLLFTPILSTISFVFLIPAVSIKSSFTPLIIIVPSTISLVVPSISVTIAFSSCNKLFSRLLFPTFGLPTIAVLIPSFIIFPFSLSFIILFISF